jgi:hypothetical protein
MTASPLAAALALAVGEGLESLSNTRDAFTRAHIVACKLDPPGIEGVAIASVLEDLAAVRLRAARLVDEGEVPA